MSAIGFILATIFFYLFNKERYEQITWKKLAELAQARARAKKEAEDRHNAVKNDNITMADDISDILNK